MLLLLQLDHLSSAVAVALKIDLQTNWEGYVGKIQDHRWKGLKKVHLMMFAIFSIGTFCKFILDNSSNNGPIKNSKLCVDAEFWANYSRVLQFFVAVMVFWQINFLYNRFSKLISTKPANLKCYESLCCHHESSYRWLSTSEIYNTIYTFCRFMCTN